tara:strand:- start:144 stop:521 length:378 start_codon:yes stop_codon:yes gene_type:complete
MKSWIYKNEHGKSELCVDAYSRLSKREFSDVLSKLEGVTILKRPNIFGFGDFCSFEYRGECFTIEEDEFDYCYNIKPKVSNTGTLKTLEAYFLNLNIAKPKTRPVFWFAGIVLVGLAIYAKLQGS